MPIEPATIGVHRLGLSDVIPAPAVSHAVHQLTIIDSRLPGNDEVARYVGMWTNAATSVRFDGSDQMVKEVNGAFWKEMTNWVSGTKDLDTALKDIDAARPK